MTDSEKLDLILRKVNDLDNKVTGIDNKVNRLDNKVTDLDNKVTDLDSKVTGIELHLENITDKNISLLAENHLSLVNKLNESVKVADKTALYEIQVRILTEKVEKLTKDVETLKKQVS